MKKLQYILGVIIFLIVGVFIGWSIPRGQVTVLESNTNQAQVGREASLMFDESDGVVKSFENESFIEGESVFDLSKRIAEREGMTFKFSQSSLGTLITEMDSKVNGTDGKYWLVWINNHMSEVAADKFILKSGDTVEWKFINLKF